MRFRTVFVTALMASALVAGGAAPAMADDADDAPTQGGASVVIRDPSITPPKSGGPSTNATVILDGTLAGTGSSKFTPTGGSSGTATVKFNTYADWGSTVITTATLKGTSSAKWAGSKPTKATSIKLYDKYWATGLGVKASYPGGSVSIDETTATVSSTASNTASNTHSINGLKFNGTLFTVNEQATGTFKFGSYTNNTYAD